MHIVLAGKCGAVIILASVSIKIDCDRDEDGAEGNEPPDAEVLPLGEQSVPLDDVGDLRVHVHALQEHEHEGDGEEVVDEDGEDPAGPGPVVERGQQQADVGENQRDLHVHLNHSENRRQD